MCGQTDYQINTKIFPSKFCSYHCYEEWMKWNKMPNCYCSFCKEAMYMKPSRIKRAKNEVTCSKECSNQLKSIYMSGEGNHQYGLKGEKNASFKGAVIEHHSYLYEYAPDHPYSNIAGRVRQHRLIVEKEFERFDSIFFENINDKKILKAEYDIHHIDENKQNNNIDNLQILTRGQHTSLHNKMKSL